MNPGLRVFVSSVQEELKDERLIVQNLLITDSFLAAHCAPVLYEYEPASSEKALEGCLRALEGCNAVILIIGIRYGKSVGGLSRDALRVIGAQRQLRAAGMGVH